MSTFNNFIGIVNGNSPAVSVSTKDTTQLGESMGALNKKSQNFTRIQKTAPYLSSASNPAGTVFLYPLFPKYGLFQPILNIKVYMWRMLVQK